HECVPRASAENEIGVEPSTKRSPALIERSVASEDASSSARYSAVSAESAARGGVTCDHRSAGTPFERKLTAESESAEIAGESTARSSRTIVSWRSGVELHGRDTASKANAFAGTVALRSTAVVVSADLISRPSTIGNKSKTRARVVFGKSNFLFWSGELRPK